MRRPRKKRICFQAPRRALIALHSINEGTQMNASTLYLVLAALGFGAALSTKLQARHLGPFVAPYWLFAWLTGELAPHAIVAHTLMAIAFITAGALDERTGGAALFLTFASIALLVRAQLRG